MSYASSSPTTGGSARSLVQTLALVVGIVFLLVGVAGLALARSYSGARTYLIGGGAVYLVLWVYGLLVGGHMSSANFVPLNTADNWLHLLLGLGMIGLGLVATRGANASTEVRA